MSNLGHYQVMTTTANRVGGPVPLGVIIFGAGVAAKTLFDVIRDKIESVLDERPINEQTTVEL